MLRFCRLPQRGINSTKLIVIKRHVRLDRRVCQKFRFGPLQIVAPA
jgi:hypothetical protein